MNRRRNGRSAQSCGRWTESGSRSCPAPPTFSTREQCLIVVCMSKRPHRGEKLLTFSRGRVLASATVSRNP